MTVDAGVADSNSGRRQFDRTNRQKRVGEGRQRLAQTVRNSGVRLGDDDEFRAWGQFLELNQLKSPQVGIYGTAAAITILATNHVDDDDAHRATPLLPEPGGFATGPVLHEEDLSLTLKVVSCLEARFAAGENWLRTLEMWRLIESSFKQIQVPGSAPGQGGWALVTSHDDLVEARPQVAHLMATALIIRIAGKFRQSFGSSSQFLSELEGQIGCAKRWLISIAQDQDAKSTALAPRALMAMALHEHHPTAEVSQAHRSLLKSIQRDSSAGDSKVLTATHPLFYSVNKRSEGSENHYAIYPVELMVGLALLTDTNTARRSVSFLNVVAETVTSMVSRHGAYRSYATGGLGLTDNLWAYQFLKDFENFLQTQKKRLWGRLQLFYFPVLRWIAACFLLAGTIVGGIILSLDRETSLKVIGLSVSAFSVLAFEGACKRSILVFKTQR